MNHYLLIGLEDFIDHIGCIRDRGIVFWKKANKRMQLGDIVYLFISDREHDKIMYRLEVTDTDSERTDREYWKHTFQPDPHCFVLTNTAAVFDGDGLGRDDLETHGISRYVQYKHLTKDQADWLDGFFKLNR